MNATSTALASGAIGAGVLTAVHEAGRRIMADAPRMDVLGMRALAGAFDQAGSDPPAPRRLHQLTLAGDLLANTLFYAAVPGRTARETWGRGLLLGTAAGVGALLLPGPLGLGRPPHSDSRRNRIATVAWYLIGGLAAAAAANAWAARAGSEA